MSDTARTNDLDAATRAIAAESSTTAPSARSSTATAIIRADCAPCSSADVVPDAAPRRADTRPDPPVHAAEKRGKNSCCACDSNSPR